jgi:hypothetical protein
MSTFPRNYGRYRFARPHEVPGGLGFDKGTLALLHQGEHVAFVHGDTKAMVALDIIVT